MNRHPNLPGQPREDAPDDNSEGDDAELQGEGNYDAARRHRESVENFVDSGQVDQAARDAEPRDDEEAQALRDAEAEGLEHAKK
jgi:hypothetical protein